MALRVLVTGRGSIAKRHVRHLRELAPQARVAVVAPGGQVDAALQPCELVASMDQGLGWKPDAVIIASISSRHADELEACLAQGLPCLAEKPLVISRAQLRRLRDAVGAAAPPVQVGCNLRHLPVLARVKALLQDGSLGRVVRAQLEVGQDLAQWRPGRDLAGGYSADAVQGGGVVFDLVHEIDMARWLLGPLALKAAVGGRLSGLGLRSDDVHTALLQDGKGAPVTVALDYVAREPVRRYAFVAERGNLVCDLMAKRLSLSMREGTQVLSEDAADFDVPATYGAQMADWLAAVRDRRHALASPLADGLETATLMLAMQEAATP